MNFFDNFCHQCDLKGVKPSRALEDAGLSKSLYQNRFVCLQMSTVIGVLGILREQAVVLASEGKTLL